MVDGSVVTDDRAEATARVRTRIRQHFLYWQTSVIYYFYIQLCFGLVTPSTQVNIHVLSCKKSTSFFNFCYFWLSFTLNGKLRKNKKQIKPQIDKLTNKVDKT